MLQDIFLLYKKFACSLVKNERGFMEYISINLECVCNGRGVVLKGDIIKIQRSSNTESEIRHKQGRTTGDLKKNMGVTSESQQSVKARRKGRTKTNEVLQCRSL